MNEVFERRRVVILETRQKHYEVSYRQRIKGIARGAYEDEEEALFGLDQEPTEVSDDDVMVSLAETLDTVRALRTSVSTHADSWPADKLAKWTALANDLERDARVGLGLDQKAEAAE